MSDELPAKLNDAIGKALKDAYTLGYETAQRKQEAPSVTSELEAIVRAVAESYTITYRDALEGRVYYCYLCDGCPIKMEHTYRHDANCPWVRARKAMGMATP